MPGLTILQKKREAGTRQPSVPLQTTAIVPLRYPIEGGGKSLVVRSRNRHLVLRGNEIQWVRARRNYVTIQASDDQFCIRETISSIEKRIAPPLIRVHRSAIVNLDFIVEMTLRPGGECSILMQDGTQLLLSRTYRKELSWIFEGVL